MPGATDKLKQNDSIAQNCKLTTNLFVGNDMRGIICDLKQPYYIDSSFVVITYVFIGTCMRGTKGGLK